MKGGLLCFIINILILVLIVGGEGGILVISKKINLKEIRYYLKIFKILFKIELIGKFTRHYLMPGP